MVDYRWSDNHFGLAGINAGMMAFSALEGEAGMAAFNAGLIPLNMGLALKGREEEISELRRDVPEKALNKVYDAALRDNMVERIGDVETDPGSRTSGRRIC